MEMEHWAKMGKYFCVFVFFKHPVELEEVAFFFFNEMNFVIHKHEFLK